MTFDPSVPLATDSPSLFPVQSQTNFTRLQTLLGADHQFNNTVATNDGYHNLVRLTQQAPSGVLASTGRLYAKASPPGKINLFYMDEAALDYQITPTMPIRAAVNFDGTGADGSKSLRSSFNVGSVTRHGEGRYKVNFSPPLPDTNYIALLTGMRGESSTSRVAVGSVQSATSYATSVDVDWLEVVFFGQDDDPRDVIMGNVTILSVT